jgi:hypothetical protein
METGTKYTRPEYRKPKYRFTLSIILILGEVTMESTCLPSTNELLSYMQSEPQ